MYSEMIHIYFFFYPIGESKKSFSHSNNEGKHSVIVNETEIPAANTYKEKNITTIGKSLI